MAIKNQMTWNGNGKRWFKKLDGKQYAITIGKLSKLYPELVVSETKEGSVKAANQWWAEKQNEVSRHPNHDQIQQAIKVRQAMARWAQLDDATDLREIIIAEMETLQTGCDDRTPVVDGVLCGVPIDPFVWACEDAAQFTERTYRGASESEWTSRLEQAAKHDSWNTSQSSEDDLAKMLRLYASEKRNGHRRNIEAAVSKFIAWMAKQYNTTKANDVTALRLVEFKVWVTKQEFDGKPISGHTANRELNLVKTFLRWLCEVEIIKSKPANLDGKNLSIPKGDPTAKTWTDEQVRKIAELPEKTRLYALLSLNLGGTAADIAAMTHENVDWEKGLFRAPRTKTGQGGDFWFPLWASTFELLKKFRSSHPEFVLTSEANTKLVSDNKGRRDLIGNNFRDNRSKAGLSDCQIKNLRKTGRSKLDENDEFARYAPTYRQESPKSVDEKYYRRPTQAQFTKAVNWIGEQYGF